jgi:outer membrane protein OmpA-like peptidoglycan-associated protein
MKSTSHTVAFERLAVLTAAAALILATPVLAQNTSANSGSSPGEYSIYEVNPFFGYQWFYGKYGTSPNSKLLGGPVLGFRVVEDFWNHAGLEESFTIGMNDLRLDQPGLPWTIDSEARNYTLAINPLFYATPRQSRVRPFVTAGAGVTRFAPDGIGARYSPALLVGAGIKFNATSRLGLRFDVRGVFADTQHANAFDQKALQATGGITIRFGRRTEEVQAPEAPPPPTPTPTPVPEIRISGISGAHDVCPGETLQLEVAASGWLPGQTPSYQWMIDGQPVAGATDSSFTVPTSASGVKTITVGVRAGEASKTSEPVTVRVKDYSAPTVRFPLAQSSIPFGTKLPLDAVATSSECGGATTIRYSASEGTIADNTFDSGTVGFDLSNRLKEQTKVVQLTATATDARGGTGSATSDLTVTLSPEARRLDDIVFPPNSARVNNCAKRLLLEQLTPMLREDASATVILIGHRDEHEKGRAAAGLDRARTLNAAAVLSAGTGICPQLELSRMKVGWVGTDQSSPAKPLLCGTSTEVKERSGQAVKASDQRAQYRRVEVWFVPGGAAMPPGITSLQDVPESEVRKLGCPK